MNAGPVPHRIVTERVTIRAYEATDAEAMQAVMQVNHERLREWMPWAWDEPQSLDTRRGLLRMFRAKFDAGQDFTMGMFDRTTGTLLGGTGLHPRGVPGTIEVGYWLAADAVGKGLMREVAAALTQVACGLDLAQQVEIHCDPTNSRSRAVPRALGFSLMGVRAEPEGSSVGRVLTEIWAIDSVQLAHAPLAAFPRPILADDLGNQIPWPA